MSDNIRRTQICKTNTNRHKGEIEKNTIIVDFNTSHQWTDLLDRKSIKQEILNDTVEVRLNIFLGHYISPQTQYTFFSSAWNIL